MKERLIELIKQGDKAFADKYTGKVMSHIDEVYEFLTDYLLANGVVVLPCKIGETLYDAREFFYKADAPDLYEMKSDDICVEKDSKSGEYRFIYDDAYVSYDEIGKTVFLTKEEAEQKLREEDEKR